MRACLLTIVLLVSPVAATAGPGNSNWQYVTSADGIAVFAREVPGRGFPTFRGIGTVDSNVFDVLAVLSDIERYPLWTAGCKEARQLRKVSEREYLLYTRIDAPWPVADRDAVTRGVVYVDRKNRVVNLRFAAIESPLKGPVKGVVRMMSFQGHYRLTVLGESKTLVDYEVDADPGGLVPKWLAKLTTRRFPLDTIRNLRKQAKKTSQERWYAERVKRWRVMEKDLVVR
jgi:hypothetical protein